MARYAPSNLDILTLRPVGATVTVVLAQARAPVSSTWLGSTIDIKFGLTLSGRPVAVSDPNSLP